VVRTTPSNGAAEDHSRLLTPTANRRCTIEPGRIAFWVCGLRPGLDLYQSEAARGITESRSGSGQMQDFCCGRQGEVKGCTPLAVSGGP
jgi:hypothetical protein